MDDLAERLGVTPVLLPELQREISPIADTKAVLAIRRIIRDRRPEILHTHTAKAGTVGRAGAVMAGRRRPRLVVHTFHGHVLSGYFSARRERLFIAVERFLAKRTDVLIAVSDEVRDDLVALGIAAPDRIRVVPLGFDLDAFDLAPEEKMLARAAMRAALGVPVDAPLVTLVARVVPIKRVDIFLEAAEVIAEQDSSAWFCIAGDGELRRELQEQSLALRASKRIIWPGFVSDMPALYAASDVVALCSDNEGTPVSLIEALATGVPAVSTRVGGVPSVIVDGVTGLLISPGGSEELGAATLRLLGDQELRVRMGKAGREHVRARFDLERLVEDIVSLYRTEIRVSAGA